MSFNVLDQEKLKVAEKKFWTSLLRCCGQFQEAGLRPLGIWHCPKLGLKGVIQQVSAVALLVRTQIHESNRAF